MYKINIHETKTHLCHYLKHLKEDEVIIICKRNEPIAEIRLISKPDIKKRTFGKYKKHIQIPKSFFDPLPKEIIDLFEGKST